MKERDLEPFIHPLIAQLHGQPLVVLKEYMPLFPLSYAKPDLIYVYPDHLVVVEIKLWNWRRGLSQVLRDRTFARFAYLALRWNRPRKVNLDSFKRLGIGVIGVNTRTGEAKVLVEPREGPTVPELAAMAMERITGLLKRLEEMKISRKEREKIAETDIAIISGRELEAGEEETEETEESEESEKQEV